MKNKLFLPLLAAFLLVAQASYGQYNYNYNNSDDDFRRNEVYGQYGVITVQSGIIVTRIFLADLFAKALNEVIEDFGAEGLDYTRDVRATRGAIGLGYNRYLAPRWTVGAMTNYQGFRTTMTFENSQELYLKDNFYTFLLRTDYRWVNQPAVQLYSGIAMGGTLWVSKYEAAQVNAAKGFSTGFFNMQVTPLGVRVGKQIGGFVEFGLGTNGLLVGGISGKF